MTAPGEEPASHHVGPTPPTGSNGTTRGCPCQSVPRKLCEMIIAEGHFSRFIPAEHRAEIEQQLLQSESIQRSTKLLGAGDCPAHHGPRRPFVYLSSLPLIFLVYSLVAWSVGTDASGAIVRALAATAGIPLLASLPKMSRITECDARLERGVDGAMTLASVVLIVMTIGCVPAFVAATLVYLLFCVLSSARSEVSSSSWADSFLVALEQPRRWVRGQIVLRYVRNSKSSSTGAGPGSSGWAARICGWFFTPLDAMALRSDLEKAVCAHQNLVHGAVYFPPARASAGIVDSKSDNYFVSAASNLQVLTEMLEAGPGKTLLVHGPLGIGKTATVMRHARDNAKDWGAVVTIEIPSDFSKPESFVVDLSRKISDRVLIDLDVPGVQRDGPLRARDLPSVGRQVLIEALLSLAIVSVLAFSMALMWAVFRQHADPSLTGDFARLMWAATDPVRRDGFAALWSRLMAGGVVTALTLSICLLVVAPVLTRQLTLRRRRRRRRTAAIRQARCLREGPLPSATRARTMSVGLPRVMQVGASQTQSSAANSVTVADRITALVGSLEQLQALHWSSQGGLTIILDGIRDHADSEGSITVFLRDVSRLLKGSSAKMLLIVTDGEVLTEIQAAARLSAIVPISHTYEILGLSVDESISMLQGRAWDLPPLCAILAHAWTGGVPSAAINTILRLQRLAMKQERQPVDIHFLVLELMREYILSVLERAKDSPALKKPIRQLRDRSAIVDGVKLQEFLDELFRAIQREFNLDKKLATSDDPHPLKNFTAIPDLLELCVTLGRPGIVEQLGKPEGDWRDHVQKFIERHRQKT